MTKVMGSLVKKIVEDIGFTDVTEQFIINNKK